MLRIFEVAYSFMDQTFLKYDCFYLSIWQEGGATRIGMIRPKAMLEMLTVQPALRQIADEVEHLMLEMIDEAR